VRNVGERRNYPDVVTLVIEAAQDVLEGVLHDGIMVPIPKGHVRVNLLKCASNTALFDAKRDTVQVDADTIHCIEERCPSEEDYGGVVSTFFSPKVYANFVHIAFVLLSKEDMSVKGPL
jgi:hypothetical protein